MCDLVHLHCHSRQSLIDGLAKPGEMIQLAKSYGQHSIAITDHGVLSGIPEFYRSARKHGINPILGCEMYIVPSATDVGFGPRGNLRDRRNFHLTLLAKNADGYRDLVKLSSWSHTRETYFYNPRIDYEMMRNIDTSNLICLSGCVMGELQETFLEAIKHIIAIECKTPAEEEKARSKGYEVVRQWAWPRWSSKLDAQLRAHPDYAMATDAAIMVMKRYRSMFPEGQYFYELMDHGFVLEQWGHRHLYSQARRYGIPAVVTNDSHYGPVEHKELHDLLMSMQWKQTFCGSTDTKRLDICSQDELYARLSHLLTKEQFLEAVANTEMIAELCADTVIPPFEEKRYRIPQFIDERGDVVERAGALIKKLAQPRLERLCTMYPERAHEYRARLRFEMSIIKKFGLYHYFLIVQDVVNWAKRDGILVGAGRGSAAGCLLAYCLRITEIDPIRHGLYFERFLSTDRMSMPDFDTDFQSLHIERVMQYLSDKYGKHNVERICAYDKLRPKSMIQSMLKALDVMSHAELIKLTKELEDDNTRTDPEYIDEWWESLDNERLIDIVGRVEYDLQSFSKALFQLPVSVSAHAAAVVIGDSQSDLSEWVPTQFVPSSNRIVTQFDMTQIEELGFVKLDTLSVGTLDTVADCVDYIGYDPFEQEISEHGSMQYDDAKTYQLITSGYTDGLFQLSGGTAKQVIKQIGGCHSFDDIVAVMSLGRPGAVKFASKYRANREANWDDVELVNDDMKMLLRKSYGVVLFQEDVMSIVWHLEMSPEHLDTIMKAVKKKDYAIFDKVGPDFIEHALNKGWTRDEAEDVWLQIRDYAGYGFNKAHAVSYADLAYKTAYLKANYPGYFIASKMKQFSTKGDAKKKQENLPALVRDGRRVGVRFFPPSVNKSDVHYKAVSSTKIRTGLADINGVGVTAAKEIIKKRPFKSDDFRASYVEIGPRGGKYDRGAEMRDVDKSKCNSGALTAMMFAGAIPGIEIENKWEAEQSLLYCNISPHPNQEMLAAIHETVLDGPNAEMLMPQVEVDHSAKDVRCGGIITRLHEHSYTVNKGKNRGQRATMAFIDIELDKHDFAMVVFADLWAEIRHRTRPGNLMLAHGRVEWDEKRGLSFIAESASVYE